jgi:acetyl esterase/lipase
MRRSNTRIGSAFAASVLLSGAVLFSCGGGSQRPATDRDAPAGAPIRWAVPSQRIPGLRQRVVGRGARAAVVLWRAGSPPPHRVVVFFHAWQALPPSTEAGWIGHLARRGNTVVYPVFQTEDSSPRTYLDDALAGTSAALRRIDPDPGSIIAIGRSVGGALAFDFAAKARASGIPAPRAVFAVFPGRRPPSGTVPAADLAGIEPGTLLEVVAGPGDPLPEGDREARDLLAAARRVPASDRRLLRPAFPAELARVAPGRGRAAERRAFWMPADRLISEARAR